MPQRPPPVRSRATFLPVAPGKIVQAIDEACADIDLFGLRQRRKAAYAALVVCGNQRDSVKVYGPGMKARRHHKAKN